MVTSSSNLHGADSVTEQRPPLSDITPAQQLLPPNVLLVAHPSPPHGSQPRTQQTVPMLFSRPTRPLLQVVFDVATARIEHRPKREIVFKGGRKGDEAVGTGAGGFGIRQGT